MGYWGSGPLENDLALDVHDRFSELTDSGLPPIDAKMIVLMEFEDLSPASPEGRIVRETLASL
jgi:hypothetical protein